VLETIFCRSLPLGKGRVFSCVGDHILQEFTTGKGAGDELFWRPCSAGVYHWEKGGC
jgi:hypothetical protein